ncbi:ulp1 protease family, C-terminal catalytic domain-containing protein [Tanacetum coccineum]
MNDNTNNINNTNDTLFLKIDIKNRKIPKRKSIVDLTPPTFSLALSTEEPELKSNKVEEKAAKRAKKRSRFLVSLYLNKKTATNGKTEPDEVMISNYLFSIEGSEFDFIFETKEGNATIRDYMQTLAPNLKIKSNVIDTYCLVLNHEQEMDNKRKKTKHFFHTGMITKDMFKWKKANGKYDEKKQYKAFSDTMKSEFKKETEMKKWKDLEMKSMFSMHLKEVQHPRATDVLNKKPTILRPKWGTNKNDTDYGIFLMMHIENYNGETARNWKLKFPTEDEGNTHDIIRMRVRFAAKMLSHEINIHRENITKEAVEFAKCNNDKKTREALILEAIKTKKEKQDSERVASAI